MYNRRFPFHHTPASGKRLDFIRIMIAIIAEKPSVGQDIARVVGATEKMDGYITGNGYMVTWALGHLVSLALPGTYGYTRTTAEDLPMIPEPFRLVPRQIRTDRGMVTDIAAGKQLKIIDEVFSKCDSIIVATDAGREGELIFRWIYSYLGYTKPFRRLWISSLTDEAIREGMANLREGSGYDSLYAAADSRAKADWLVGMNASRALATASGSANNSIGRVQTPTLAMICARFKENRNFVSTPYWQLHIALKKDDVHRQFFHPEDFRDKNGAEAAYRRITSDSVVTINKVERKTVFQQAPLLYDLTALQKDCNIHHDLSADKTLSIAQSLYEKKLVSYPRTGSRYIPEDVMAHVPALLEKVITMPWFREYGRTFDLSGLNTRSVDATKVTDHHALLVTPNRPLALYKNEQFIYDMIVGRMIEAFSPECVKDTTTVRAECEGVAFETKGCIVRKAGWRSVYGEDREDTVLPDWKEGDTLAMNGCTMSSGMTRPKPLHTESTLLAAMETAGREGVEDEEARQALKDCGIGTPATRAAIIETLLRREYMVRVKKSLVPTEKGLALYSIVKGMDIADVEMTGRWEKELAEIEKGRTPHEAFLRDIEGYTRKITTELLACDKIFGHKASGCACPKCGTGTMQFYGKVVRCDNPDCALPVFRQIAGRTLTDAEMTGLLAKGKTDILSGFKSKQGKPFSAAVAFDADFNTKFIFPEAKGTRKSTNMKGRRK